MTKRIPLGLEHKALIEKLCHDLHLTLSEYNFSNLLLFRKIHNYELVFLDNGHCIILGLSRAKEPYLMPFTYPYSMELLLTLMKEFHSSYIYPIPEERFDEIKKYGEVQVLDEESDYLYDRDLIQTLRGRHLDGQRNHVRNLLSEHTLRMEHIQEHNIEHAFQVLKGWASQKKPYEQTDFEECQEALHLFSKLSLQGWLFFVDDKPSGFLLGEPLTEEVFLYHFIKTLPFKGLAPCIFQEVAKDLPQQYKYLNWEQDLGLPGLRKFKKSFFPLKLLKTGRWFLKTGI
jgi:uncharacterized protein